MKIIITGGSGFIGTNAVNYYLNRGYEVLNIDKVKPQDSTRMDCWKQIDVRDAAALKEAVVAFEPDYILHLAGRTDLDGATLEDYDANYEGTENILAAADACPSLKKIIITSSQLVCHIGYLPKDQHDYCPTTNYGRSKVRVEEITWDHQPKCDWAFLRPTSIWGPYFGVPYCNFFKTVIRGMYFHMGSLATRKTYGYIDNTLYQIDCILHADTTNDENKVFYIGDYEPYNIREWANEIAHELHRSIPVFPLFVAKAAALFGDFLKLFGIHFPMTSFRLKNMSTDNIVDMSHTKSVAPDLPVSRLEGVRTTLKWLHATE